MLGHLPRAFISFFADLVETQTFDLREVQKKGLVSICGIASETLLTQLLTERNSE